VVIAPDGDILTDSHVVHNARRLATTFTDGTQANASLIGEDPASDLTVIRADVSGLPYALLGDSGALRVGQVVAINEQLVNSIDDLHRFLADWPIRNPVMLTVLRGQDRLAVQVSPDEAN
jgi:S1-C subfamily serine protease